MVDYWQLARIRHKRFCYHSMSVHIGYTTHALNVLLWETQLNIVENYALFRHATRTSATYMP